MKRVDRIKSMLSEIEYGYIGYGNMHENDDEGLEIIEEALEKQIPKKPIVIDIFRKKESVGYYCPNCDCMLLFGAYDVFEEYTQNNCDECGQAIDWSEGE